MALFRRLFYRKPPDRLLEISERVYVFDCCFSSEIMEDNEYKNYLGFIVAELQGHFPDTSFMVCNFREGDKKSHISDILSEYDMTVMDYPRQYECCPLLPLEMIHHFLKSSESWLSLEGQHNVLLMHCERGGWPVLAFMLAGFLLYRKQYTGEQKTLEMVYKQAPKELLHLFCPLNPQPSHLRYLQYITRQGDGLEWPPKDKPFLLKCIILSVAPLFDGKGGCRPVVRVYGQNPQTPTNRTSMILFSTLKTKKHLRHYRQEESAVVKLNARCHVRGDVIIECIHVDEDLEHEEMMCRIMFNTAFVESDTLLLNRNEIDVAWNAKDQFPRDFKAEVIFSDFDAGESEVTSKAAATDDYDDEREGASTEEFFEAEEIFNNSEIHVDTQLLRTKSIHDVSGPNSDILVATDNVVKKLNGTLALENSNNTINEKLKRIDRKDVLFEPAIIEDQVENTFEASVSEPDVISEKIINLDDVIALEEKRMLESSILMRKTDPFSSIVQGESTSKYGHTEPKTIYTSETIFFTQTTLTVDDAVCKMENLPLTNAGNNRIDSSSSSRESLKSAIPQRTSILDGRDLKNVSSNRANRASMMDGRGCNSSDVSTIDQTKRELDSDDGQHDTRSELKVYSDSRLETPYPADHAESGSEITIHDKAIITEKLISLNEMNGVEENNVAEIDKLKQEGGVAPLPMEQKGTTETHLKFVVGVYTHKDSDDDKIDKPNTLILGDEAKSVLKRSDSKNDLEKIYIFKESIKVEKNQVVSSSSVVKKAMHMPGSFDSERDNSNKASESQLLTQMTGVGSEIQNNEKVLPRMPEKNPTQNSHPFELVIAKNKCIQQEASNLLAKTAKTKIIPRWISPKRTSNATSVHWPSNLLSRYNSSPPALAISFRATDERSHTEDVLVERDSLNGNITSMGGAPSPSVTAMLPSKQDLVHLLTSCHHVSAPSLPMQPLPPSPRPPGMPLVQPVSFHTKNSSPPPPPPPPPPLQPPPPQPPPPPSINQTAFMKAPLLSPMLPPPPPPPPPLHRPPLLPSLTFMRTTTQFSSPPPPPPPPPPPATLSRVSIKISSPSSDPPPLPPPSPPPSINQSAFMKASLSSSILPPSTTPLRSSLGTFSSPPPPPPPPPPPFSLRNSLGASIPPPPPPPPPLPYGGTSNGVPLPPSPPSKPNASGSAPPIPPPPPPPPPPPSKASTNNSLAAPPLPPPPPPISSTPPYGGSSNGIPLPLLSPSKLNASGSTPLIPPPPPPPPKSIVGGSTPCPPPLNTSTNGSLGAPPPPPPPPPPLPPISSAPPYGRVSNGIPTPPPPSKQNAGGSTPLVSPPPPPPPKPIVGGSSPCTPLLTVSMKGSTGAPPPPPPPPPPPLPPVLSGTFEAPTHPPMPRVPPPPPPPSKAQIGATHPPPPRASGVPPPPPPPHGGCTNAPPPPPPRPPPGGSRVAPPPPPPPPGGRGSAPPPPPPLGGRGSAPPPPPPPGGHGNGPPPPPPPGGRGTLPAPPRAPGVPPPPPLGSPDTPGGSRGPPPPSSLVGGRGQGISRPVGSGSSSQAPRRSSLKPLHWVKVTRAVQGSLWAELQKSGDASSASEFDASELEILFSAVSRKSDDSSKADGKRKSLGSKSEKVHLIELRRANNTEIMLTKVKMPLPDLMTAALALDESVLDADQVDNLIKFCPTKEEMELLKGYSGDKEKLGKCEQFFLELMKVPRVESKLRVFSFKIQFHQQIADLRKSLNTIDSACEQIRSSDKLKEIMKKILYLGNMLNQGTARGSAIGFRLDSLLKLTDTRATNNKMTLMHYLCKVIALRSSYLLDFHEDLTSLESASKIQLKSLAEEMQAIVKGLEKVELELTASESDGPVSLVFQKTLKGFTAVADAEARSLASLYSAVGRNADALAIYFGEDPARCPFEQVISTLMNFVQMFRRAHQENCKQAELEKKKAQKEAEIEKSKSSKSIK